MNREQARQVIIEALAEVAPEVDPTGIAADVDFTEQLDLDSMDYLNWLIEIHHATGIEIPERDYSQLMTMTDATGYLVAAGTESTT